MRHPLTGPCFGLVRASLALAFVSLFASGVVAQAPAKTPATDLDTFMARVLAKRDVNRQTLQQYILDDIETFEVLGPGRIALHRGKREFSWYERDGMHVRSPVRFDGVTIGDEDRRKYEDDWIKQERERQERRAKKTAGASEGAASSEPAGPPVGGDTPIATPRFVSEAYFMDFKFEPGNYYLAGREQLDGHAVLKIEYYPTRMFDGEEPDRDRDNDRKGPAKPQTERDRKQEQDIDRKMNKTALVTLWIDPAEQQIVKYTFDNIWMDFLPGAWLVRVDDIHASMTMHQPFAGVWLPHDLNVHAGVSLASGPFEATYARQFANYRLAEVKSTIRVKQEARGSGFKVQGSGFEVHGSGIEVQPEGGLPHGPAVWDEPDQQAEVVREIRVHGNAAVLDADVIALAGLSVGQALPAGALDEVEARLRRSGKFESIEVRKRYRSLDDATDVAIVLVVHERPGTISVDGTIRRRPRPFGRVGDRLMFLPIVNYADGYGLTYGARMSTDNVLGAGEHLSVPLTWGGTRRVALEAGRTFTHGPLTRLESSVAIWQRENPHFELDDRRVEWKGRAERQLARIVQTGAEFSHNSVNFGGRDDRLWTFGADATLDTRADPTFPRNAVVLGARWDALAIRSQPARINRYTTDARGYLGTIGQAVLAGRLQYTGASARLPDYERLLLGGESTLRGFRAGTFDGDRMLDTSAEIRVPLTSVLSSARLGVIGFLDVARAWDFGDRFADTRWHKGAGAGLFLIAPLVRLNLDLAKGLTDGDTRLHLGAGFSF